MNGFERDREREREAPWNGERPNGRMAGWLAGARAEAEGGAILRLTSERGRERERERERDPGHGIWFYGLVYLIFLGSMVHFWLFIICIGL